MPISATMSLWGLYQYDNTILDGLTVPTGMDSNNVKQNLLIETASLEILYPDPNFLKTAISLWSAERKDVWDKLYATTQLQYDPIENYDRMEESEEQNTGISTSESSGTTSNIGTQSKSTSQTDNTEQNRSTSQADSGSRSGTNTATNSATAYNSNTFADTAKTITSGSDDSSSNSIGTEDVSASGSSNGTENSSTSGSENSSTRGSASETGNRIFKSRIHGNIGVKTAMAMIQEQREVVQFCMQEYIINDFVQRFCIMVY